MTKNLLFFLAFLALCVARAGAQDSYTSYNDRVKKYIDTYYPLAIAEQRIAGIPASITLGQGILETDAGASDLVTYANNHFGIKCLNNWQGETYIHSDDKPNECFKKYNNAAESYRDHSEHLKKNPRYKSLFVMSMTDYAAWAIGLKRCGYATSKQYAQHLIKIIEDFKLMDYTYSALDSSFSGNYPVVPEAVMAANKVEDTAKPADWEDNQPAVINSGSHNKQLPPDAANTTTTGNENTANKASDNTNIDTSKIVMVNGQKAFYAYKGEMLLPYAIKYHMLYPTLLEINGLPNAPLDSDQYVYLEEKQTYTAGTTHLVKEGETLPGIAEAEGVPLKKLLTLNQLRPNEQPVTGSLLALQKPTRQKPQVRTVEMPAHNGNAITNAPDTTETGGALNYIQLKKHKKATPGATAAPADDNSVRDNGMARTEQNDAASKKNKPAATTAPKNNADDMGDDEESAADSADEEDLGALKKDLDREVYGTGRRQAAARPAAANPNRKVSQKAAPAATVKKYYLVKKGETAGGIANRNHITLKQLLKWNGITAAKVRAGQKLIVADPGGADDEGTGTKTAAAKNKKTAPAGHANDKGSKYYVIKKGDNATRIAKKNNISVAQLLKLNDIDPDDIRAGQKLRVR